MTETSYILRGADGRDYGPVTAEQVRQWVAENRANRATWVRMAAGGGWTRVGALAEFQDLFPPPPPPPPRGQAPAAVAAPGKGVRLAEAVLARGYTLEIGDCLTRSWQVLMERFWLVVGATAMVFFLQFGIWHVPVLGAAAGLLLGFVLMGGLDLLFLRLLRRESGGLETVFIGFSAGLVPLMLAGLVAYVLTGAGLLLCILPGIYLLVAWHLFAPLLILDKGLDFWDALECSRRVVSRHWWTCFALTLLASLVALVGLLALVVGFFITLPLAVGAVVAAYETIFGGLNGEVEGGASTSAAGVAGSGGAAGGLAVEPAQPASAPARAASSAAGEGLPGEGAAAVPKVGLGEGETGGLPAGAAGEPPPKPEPAATAEGTGASQTGSGTPSPDVPVA